MKLIGHRFWNHIWFARVMMFVLALALLGAGFTALNSNRLHYRNYWGGIVFAPLSILLGFGLLVALVLKWRTLTEAGPELKGKAARQARKAEATRFPIDDYDKPWNG